MGVIQLIAKGIGKIWSFATTLILIALVVSLVVFGLTIFMPDAMMRALDIVKGWLMEVGIVGTG